MLADSAALTHSVDHVSVNRHMSIYRDLISRRLNAGSVSMAVRFLGRNSELASLNKLRSKSRSSLVAVTGRRRIGKSTLVEEFSRNYKNYVNVQWLAPRSEQSKCLMCLSGEACY